MALSYFYRPSPWRCSISALITSRPVQCLQWFFIYLFFLVFLFPANVCYSPTVSGSMKILFDCCAPESDLPFAEGFIARPDLTPNVLLYISDSHACICKTNTGGLHCGLTIAGVKYKDSLKCLFMLVFHSIPFFAASPIPCCRVGLTRCYNVTAGWEGFKIKSYLGFLWVFFVESHKSHIRF